MRTIRDEDSDNDPVSINDVECVGASKLAIHVRIDGALRWIPQSQVSDDSEVYALGHKGTLVVSGWFARKEGLSE